MFFAKIFLLVFFSYFIVACNDEQNEIPSTPEEIYNLAIDYFNGISYGYDRDKSVKLLTIAAEQYEYDKAEYMLGNLYYEGISVPKNYQLATDYFIRAADKGIVEAQIKLSSVLYSNTSLLVSDQVALQYLKMAAQYDAKSMAYLAYIYDSGELLEKNKKEAFRLFNKSAQYNEPIALLNLAKYYFDGVPNVVLKDYHKAINYLQLAKKEEEKYNGSQALYEFGIVYLEGKGVNQDKQLAIDYFVKAAKNNNDKAIKKLVEIYLEDQDYSKGLPWILILANKKDSHAQQIAAQIYELGLGSSKDLDKAIEWYEQSLLNGNKSVRFSLLNLYIKNNYSTDKISGILSEIINEAEKGDLASLSNLFYLYSGDTSFYNEEKFLDILSKIKEHKKSFLLIRIADDLLEGNNGVRKNEQLAISILKDLADHKIYEACFSLGKLYEEGKFVITSKVKAIFYFTLAKERISEAKNKIKSIKLNKNEQKLLNGFVKKFKSIEKQEIWNLEQILE